MRDDYIDEVATAPAPTGYKLAVVLSAVFAGAVLVTNLPRINSLVWPVLGQQEIPPSTVTRTSGVPILLVSGPNAGQTRWKGATLCWMRVSYKNYITPVPNYDVFLDRRDPKTGEFSSEFRSFPEVFDEESGDPLATDDLPGPGWSRRRRCIALPSKVSPTQPVRLQQFAHFRGLWNLWELPPTQLPDIVSKGATPQTPPP